MAAANNIYGFVRSHATGKGIQGLEVQLFAKHIGGEMPSSMGFTMSTNPDGLFQFVLDDATLGGFFIGDEPVQVVFRVSDGATVLQEPDTSFVWTKGFDTPAIISVDHGSISDNTAYSIHGYLRNTDSKPLAGLNVELFTRHANGNPSEEIGFTTTTNAGGFFQFLVLAEALVPLFEPAESIQVGFQVANADEILLAPEDSLVWLTQQVEPVVLVVDIREIPTADIEIYTVAGEVFYSNNTTRENLQVRLYNVKFREEILLVSGATNSKGKYKLLYSTSLFENESIDRRNIQVKVYDESGSTLLATSNIAIAADLTEMNFEIPTSESSPINFGSLTARIVDQISGVAVNTLTDADISYLSIAMEVPATAIEQIVKVHQYSAEVSSASTDNPALMYALAAASDTLGNPVLNFRDAEIRDNVSKAMDARTIPNIDPGTIEDFVNAARDYKVSDTRNLQIAGEDFVLNDILTSIFSNDTELTQFLYAYSLDEAATPKDFWENYADEYGPAVAIQAKKGITLMAVTGFQPEVIADLLGEVDGDVNIRKLAAWDEATWINRIDTICTNANRLCVPIAIRLDSTDVDDTVAKNAYAKTLKTVIQDLYPLANIQAKLEGSGGADLIANAGRRADAITFLENNPAFDLRMESAKDINPIDYNLTGVADVEALKEELEPFQRLLRVSGGKPEAVAAFKVDGVVSAMDITAKGLTEFTSDYGDVLGGEEDAVLTYSRAELIDNTTTEITMDFYQSFAYNDPQSASMESNASFLPFYNPTPTDPNLVSLFGNLDFCSCRDCLSLFSPSAYLTDMLRFLEKEVTDKDIFAELMRRRKDLKHIDLSCKNTNTAMPYIDLVNELLENQIVTPTPIEAANSFQTKGTAGELKGYPEHIYKSSGNVYTPYINYTQVYDTVLPAAIYPDILPFSLALEETRTYYNHMGVSRYTLMQLFKPKGLTPPANGITDDAIYTEGLNLPFAAKTIITATHTSSTSPWLFYGIAASTTTSTNGLIDPAGGSTKIFGVWTDILKNYLDITINQLKITYKEFLQLMTTDFLNKPVSGVRKITIVVDSPSVDENTCVIRDLKLEFTGGATPADLFDKLYRFVRLWKASGTSITNLDAVLRLFGATNLNEANFKLLGRILEVSDTLNISPEYLAMWWTSVDTVRYINYNSETLDDLPSIYDQIFRNKAVVNLPIAAFDNPASLPANYVGQTALIAAFCLITEEDVFRILNFLEVNYTSTPVTLTILSRIFTFGAIAKSLEYSVADLLDLFYILKFKTTSPVSNLLAADHDLTSGDAVLTYLETLLTTTSYLKASGFSLADTNYLSRNIDTANQYFPDDENIQLFYEGLRTELKKFPIYVAPTPTPPVDGDLNRLTNVIYQYFAKEFNMTSAWVEAIISTMVLTTGDVGGIIRDFIKASFVESTLDLTENATIGSFQIKDLYLKYRLIHKIKFLFDKLALKNEEFIFLYKSANTAIVNFDFSTLPVDTTVSQTVIKDTFDAVLRLSQWMKVRARLSLTPDDFIALLKASKISAGGSKAQWLSLIEKNTKWGALLTDLVGISSATSDAGILQVSYDTHFVPSDIKSPRLILTIAEIVKWCTITGLNPTPLYASLMTNVTMADSHKVLLAAKGKHQELAWAEIAKPLRDVLREKQRNALVAYLVARPSDSVSGDKKLWRNENELYSFLLIDVQMQPCMMTSRIKQAISSVQLFIDRILLGIEYKNYGTTKLKLSPAHTKQWETWRKWYRIWEANRKVFLYPENWLEPELRDGKSVFFQELETELLQDEFTETRAEDAFRNYLLKLDGISRLEPAGSCYDWETGILHAFGRSYGSPHYYYYRRLVDNEWTPWERMDLEIDGDHIVPIVWSRRLYIFWVTFKDKMAGHPGINPVTYPDYWDGTWSKNPWFLNEPGLPFMGDGGGQDGFPMKQYHIEISLNWSEYKDGQWLKHKIGQDTAVLKTNPSLDKYLSTQIRNYNPDYFKLISHRNQLSMTDIVKSRLFLFPYLHKPEADNILTLWVMHPAHDPDERHQFMTGFTFPDNNAEPKVIRTWMYDWNFPAPSLTYTNNMKFMLNPGYSYKGLQVDKIKGAMYMGQTYDYNNEDYSYTEPRIRSSQQDILKSIGSNGLFKIRSKSNFGDNPLENHFFYEDDRNTFFVRVVELEIVATASTGGGGTTTTAGKPISGGTTSGIAAKGTPKSAGMLISKNDDITFNTVNDISRDIYPALPAAAMGVGSSGSNALQNASVTYNAPLALNNNALVGNFKNTAPYYYFQTFYHPHVNKFVKALNTFGIDGLLKLEMQIPTDTMNFPGQYQPTTLVTNHGGQFIYPQDKVDFDYWGTYSSYNWELFFHTPMMIALQLSNNQKFSEARRWFHYIFDPTSNVNDVGAPSTNNQRFWRFRPFYKAAGEQIETLAQLLDKIHNGDYAQVTKWENNPFKPHVIARQRILAYMKNVVMKYLDNLIAWGDQLFRQDTIEAINEATQLYILAANILGRKPQEIPPRGQFTPKSYAELSVAGLDKFSNAKVKLESYIAPNGPLSTGGGGNQPIAQKSVYYFCLTKNDKLMGYWDTVADRLFKIRNCMSIDGQARQLPLFEPPIDPGMLVKAAAAGVDIASVLNDLSSTPSFYRFNHIAQKANEFCNDVKSLGGALLSALEKKDAEALAVLRSTQEISVQEKTLAVKLGQIEEIKANMQALEHSKEGIQTRIQFYSSRVRMNPKENEHMNMLRAGIPLHTKQADKQALSSTLAVIPTFSIQAPFALGPSFGGGNLSSAASAMSTKIGADIAINSIKSSMAQAIAGYDRRWDDWQFQIQVANKELQQVDKQMVSSELRLKVAEKELEVQQLQIENSRAVDEYMRGKYTNEKLYSWMISQISMTYFQSYQLAYDMAKKAERCYEFELPLALKATGGYIKFGYWDSLKKGLMSAEKLQYDLRKLEVAYIENNVRELELTKNVSLAAFNPRALIDLVKTGKCTFFIPEELFDLDYPGHYLRRLKAVSITIPCITGPYTTISCKLTLVANAIRSKTTTVSGDLVLGTGVPPSIATSSGQNDSGLFELNFKDERYLPFEGKGAVSQWELQIVDVAAGQVALFDLETISDAILHLKYTARDAGQPLQGQVITKINSQLSAYFSDNTIEKANLPRYFSLKHEYGTEWGNYINDHLLNLAWNHNDYPFYCDKKTISLKSVYVTGILKQGIPAGTYRLRDTTTPSGSGISAQFGSLQTLGTPFTIAPGVTKNFAFKVEKDDGGWIEVDIDSVFEDIYLVVFYNI